MLESLALNGSLLLSVNGNAGCGVQLTEDDNSFGPGFNSIGGGWYVHWSWKPMTCLRKILQVCHGTHG